MDHPRLQRALLGVLAALATVVSTREAAAQVSEADACTTQNLLASRAPSEAQLVGNAALVTDGEIVPDGALWDGPAAAELGTSGSLTYDLGSVQRVSALY